MVPDSCSLRTRSAAAGADSPSSAPRSAQVVRASSCRRVSVFESNISSTKYIIIDCIDPYIRTIHNERMTHPFLASPEALDAFIQDWRNGRLARAAWTHAAHVAVCAALAVDRDADATF